MFGFIFGIFLIAIGGFSHAEAKFTCIDTNRILSESKLVADAQGELRTKLVEYQNKLKKKEKKLEELKKQIESKAISKKVKEKKIQEYQKLESEARKLQEKAQRELTEMRQRLENMVFNRVKEASEKIAKERGLAGILDCGAFIYRDPDLDITTEVIKLIDAGKK